MVADHGAAEAQSEEESILQRMLEDADRLCANADTLLAGQCIQLRGRIAALLHVVASPDGRMDDPS